MFYKKPWIQILLFTSLLFPTWAFALTFTVNSTADPGTGSCDATECTLREAILAANANPNSGGPDLIDFAIPVVGNFQTIALNSELPTITDPVVLDGRTQLQTDINIGIELDGTNAGATATGLSISAAGSTITGFAINRFGCDGIHIFTGGGNKIELNAIGTDASGTIARGNGCNGVFIDGSPNNFIGNAFGGTENLISANSLFGIAVGGTASVGNHILGNFIGTDDNQTLDLGNEGGGIYLGPAQGVHSGSSSQTQVGGDISLANIISRNHFTGVSIHDSSTGNVVRANFITLNSSIGIDFESDGVTQNDSCDADGGGNLHQNFPVLTSITTGGGNTTINGFLNSKPNTDYMIDFYNNTINERQGENYFATEFVTTDNNCNAAINSTFGFDLTGFITATATDPDGNTSEFSAIAAPVSICTFEDFFDDNVMDWLEIKPSVTESGGFLVLTSTTGKAVAFSPSQFTQCSNCTFTAEILFSGEAHQKASMLTHNVDKRNRIEVLFKPATGKVIVKVRRNGLVIKKKGTFTFLPNIIYSVSLTYDGANITLLIDGSQILSFAPGVDIPEGGMGFISKGGILSVNHVCVHQ